MHIYDENRPLLRMRQRAMQRSRQDSRAPKGIHNMKKIPKIHLGTRVKVINHDALKIEAAKNDRSVSSMLDRILSERYKKQKKIS